MLGLSTLFKLLPATCPYIHAILIEKKEMCEGTGKGRMIKLDCQLGNFSYYFVVC